MALRVLILGATSPIARALALRFARDGATVYLAARDLEEARRIACDLNVRSGARALVGAFDARDIDAHPRVVQDAIAELGGLDGVVVAFGTLGDEATGQLDPSEALATITQNFTGAVSIMTLAGEHLREQSRGFIIVLSSVAGDRGRARNYVYGSAKGALTLFAQGLRARLSPFGVHVMTAKLGFVDTRMTWGRDGLALVASPEGAADKIYSAWRRGAEVVYVPAFWRPIMGALKLVPERIFKRLTF
jgi:NAD(P)-dependent dehydrogenase (short-subunit alcohol dehydrogenase family)